MRCRGRGGGGGQAETPDLLRPRTAVRDSSKALRRASRPEFGAAAEDAMVAGFRASVDLDE